MRVAQTNLLLMLAEQMVLQMVLVVAGVRAVGALEGLGLLALKLLVPAQIWLMLVHFSASEANVGLPH